MNKVISMAFFLALVCTVASAQTHDDLKSGLAAAFERSSLPAVSVALVSTDGVTFSHALGEAKSGVPATPQSRFVAGGLGEALVSVALAMAVEEGKLSWDTPLKDVLPFNMVNAVRGGKPLTIWHLATHTSGLNDQNSDFMRNFLFLSEPDLDNPAIPRGKRRDLRNAQYNNQYSMGYYLRLMLTADGQFNGRNTIKKDPPGSVYSHSYVGAALAGYIIELIYQMGFDDFVNQRIFEPLQMKNSSWKASSDVNSIAQAHHDSLLIPLPVYNSILYPAYGLYSTAEDLGLFMAEMIRGSKGDGKLLAADTYQDIFKLQFSGSDMPQGIPITNTSLFWDLNGSSFEQSGTSLGYSGYMAFDPATSTGRIFLTNAEVDSRTQFKKAFDEIWQLLGEYAPALAGK